MLLKFRSKVLPAAALAVVFAKDLVSDLLHFRLLLKFRSEVYLHLRFVTSFAFCYVNSEAKFTSACVLLLNLEGIINVQKDVFDCLSSLALCVCFHTVNLSFDPETKNTWVPSACMWWYISDCFGKRYAAWKTVRSQSRVFAIVRPICPKIDESKYFFIESVELSLNLGRWTFYE